MCGINGCLLYNNVILPNPLDEILHSMNHSLKHRGPDDNGIWVNEHKFVGLGQTRLSILDLTAAGHQPMKDSLSGNIITYNGEVFNYKDINTTNLSNAEFISGTDTETILKLYCKYGISALPKLNGMFGFGLWDNKEQSLILARDRSGKKPLYYTEMNGIFVFASELKAILTLPWINRELDEEALYDFLTYNTALSPKTMFRNIYKFLPGYYMIVNRFGIRTYESYYSLKKINLEFDTEKQLQDLIFNKLEESVKYRMIADVPVGAFLSGGVDSSAIVALMRQNTRNEIKTFTIGFENQPEYNELVQAEKVSKMFGTNHFVKMVAPNDLLEFIPKITEIYDEPQADSTSIPIYFISKLAKEQGIKVVLNGDGPDELFAGYSNYLKYIKYHPYYSVASKLPRIARQLIMQMAGMGNKATPYYEMAYRLNKGQDFYWPGAAGLKEGVKNQLLSSEFNEKMKVHDSYWYVDKLKTEYVKFSGAKNNFDFINWLSYSGYKHADIERFLFRADRLGMANSIEMRSPFLNYEMIELALSIPGIYKIKNSEPKYILKKSLERILPHDILFRKKMGFCLPLREWASDTITTYVDENIDLFNKEINLLNIQEVKNQVRLLK